MSEIDWDALAGAVPILLWILFLALKKRGQRRFEVDEADPDRDETPAAPQAPASAGRRRRRTRDETEFERGYDPIEPS